MIKLYKELNVHDFRNEFEGLDNTSWADEWEALGVLYDYLEGSRIETFEGMTIRDWLRFQVMEMTAVEIEENYGVDFERFPEIDEFLDYHTMLYGTYESNGKTFYLFDEF